jgi:hypothetical protein
LISPEVQNTGKSSENRKSLKKRFKTSLQKAVKFKKVQKTCRPGHRPHHASSSINTRRPGTREEEREGGGTHHTQELPKRRR